MGQKIILRTAPAMRTWLHTSTLVVCHGRFYRVDGYRVPVKNALFINDKSNRVTRQIKDPDTQGPLLEKKLIVVEVYVSNMQCYEVEKTLKPDWSEAKEGAKEGE